jgi:hypothetical protein
MSSQKRPSTVASMISHHLQARGGPPDVAAFTRLMAACTGSSGMGPTRVTRRPADAGSILTAMPAAKNSAVSSTGEYRHVTPCFAASSLTSRAIE